MIKQENFLALLLANTVFAFLIDFYVGYSENWLLVILMEVPIIVAIVLAMKDYKWAYIFTIIYYLLRSFNFYFENFYLMTKNGINFEISVNSVGVNVLSLIFFILLFYDLQRKFDSKSTKLIRTLSATFLGLVICLGLLTAKSKKYDQSEYTTPMAIELDTLAVQGTDFIIDIPEDW